MRWPIFFYFLACETIIVASEKGVKDKYPKALGAFALQNGLQNGNYFWKEKYDGGHYIWWYSGPSTDYWAVCNLVRFIVNRLTSVYLK